MRDRYDRGYLEGSTTWNPASLTVSPCDVTSTTVTVVGAKLGDFVQASFSIDVSDTQFEGHVTAADTVTVCMSNVTDVTKDLASGTVRVRVFPL